MSTPTPDLVGTVAPEVKPANVADNVNDHTPDPQTPPVVDRAPEPPRPDVEGLDELKTLMAGLATAVTTLTEAVLSTKKDASPASVPWTHKGSHAQHENGGDS